MPQKPPVELEDARRLLDLLGEGDPHTFQWFDDTKQTRNAGYVTGHLADLWPTLQRHNQENCGIYFMVNAGTGAGRDGDCVTAVRALFVDVDGTPLQPVHDAPIAPHALVQSGKNNYHAYWLVKDCPLGRFGNLQKAMARRFGSDASVSGLPHVLRVPGFYNRKTKHGGNFRVTLLSVEPSLPIPVDTLITAFGLAKLEEEEIRKAKDPLPDLDGMTPKSIPEGDRHELLKRYAFDLAKKNTSRFQILATLRAINDTYCCSPKPDSEVVDLVDSALRKVPNVDLGPFLAAVQEADEKLKAAAILDPEPDDDLHTEMAVPAKYVTSAPGLVGLVAEWIDRATPRHQPHFAFAAALSFVGLLKGHRVQTPRRTRTNHITLALGKSGSGKSQVGDRIDDLIKAAGLDALAMGIPASDSAMRSALANRQGRAYLYWDEMGLALERMLSKNSASFERAIKDLMVEVWTKSHAVLRRKELISPEAQKHHVDINQPCFGMYATAQPDIFYGALSGAHAADGFFPRLLVFETPDNYPPEREIAYADPPEELVDACQQIQYEWPTNAEGGGNLAGLVINPRVVPFTPAAQRLFDAVKKDIEKKLARLNDSLASGIWARTLSHVEKISLTVSDGDVIEAAEVEWTIDLMLRLSAAMSAAFKLRVSDTAVERVKKKVLQVISQGGGNGIANNQLTRKTQFLRDSRERETILKELTESGQIQMIEDNTLGRPVKRWAVVTASTPASEAGENKTLSTLSSNFRQNPN